MQTSVRPLARRAGAVALLATLVAFSGPAHATTAYSTNEKGNSISVIDLDKLEVTHTVQGRARGRAA